MPSSQIYQATRVLTNAEILTLPSTYIEVIPAPGADKIAIVLAAYFTMNATAGAFTNVTNDPSFINHNSLSLAYGDDDANASGYINAALALAVGSAIQTFSYIPPSCNTSGDVLVGRRIDVNIGLSGVANKPIKLISYNDDGDFEDGNVANSGVVNALYTIIDV